jgi:hypothetical protein
MERERPDFRVDANIANQLKPIDPYGNSYDREQRINLHICIVT